MSHVTVVVGAQWGDEGKGKWVDVLAKDTKIVARFQGGNNAGHTIWVDGQKHVLHQIPSGVFQKDLISAMAAGVVIHPAGLINEITKIKGVTHVSPGNLWISPRAHVISPWHVFLDGKQELESNNKIGTTKRGIGPTYSSKSSRTGLRIEHYVNTPSRNRWIETMIQSDAEFQKHFESSRELWHEFNEAADHMKPFVCDVESKLRQAAKNGTPIILEGAQGTLLDIDHGTYPYVTSSSTTAPGASASIGLPSKAITKVIGIAKAYVTRVGSGPFPTELNDHIGLEIAKRGNEFGATTGRPRRCGWFDAVAMRYAAAVNGFDSIIVNKMDILTGIDSLQICVNYRHPLLGVIADFPSDPDVLSECEPVYETFPGWHQDIPKSGRIDQLPQNAKSYLRAIEQHTGTNIEWVGTGPGRSEMLSR